MTTDDEFERRLRETLTTPRAADRVDTEEFLSQVHHGAKVRRVKRGVGIGVAAAVMVAAGGAAVQLDGLFSTSKTPAADHSTGQTLHTGTPSTGLRSTPPSTTPTTKQDSNPPTLVDGPSVPIAKNGAVAAAEWQPKSLTATGTMHQWVLAKTPSRDCANRASGCASVAVTTDHGNAWTDLGHLPAAPAAIQDGHAATVNQLRFVKRADGTYDGWAFGNALYSTHDSGATWAHVNIHHGQVTQLEGWGGQVWAGVSSTLPGDDRAWLYTSPTTSDDWTRVDLGHPLTGVESLAASQGVIGLIDSGANGRSQLYISVDGTHWQQSQVCPSPMSPTALSTASDTVKNIGSLWVTCSDATSSAVFYAETLGTPGSFGAWTSVDSLPITPTAVVAARTPTEALVASGGLGGIERVTHTTSKLISVQPTDSTVFFGFTNASHGYLITSDGTIIATINGGTSWAPYAVTDTPATP